MGKTSATAAGLVLATQLVFAGSAFGCGPQPQEAFNFAAEAPATRSFGKPAAPVMPTVKGSDFRTKPGIRTERCVGPPSNIVSVTIPKSILSEQGRTIIQVGDGPVDKTKPSIVAHGNPRQMERDSRGNMTFIQSMTEEDAAKIKKAGYFILDPMEAGAKPAPGRGPWNRL